jgi:hypothetical protein
MELYRDAQYRLHNEHGPAVAYLDGFSIYAIHGVRVPADIVEHPENITIQQIDGESNAEIKRLMIDRYGMERFLTDGNAKKIHQDICGELYRREVKNDEPIVAVKVVNSTPEPDGTYHVYFLRVPPTVKTARAAVAWTFEIDPSQYEPQVQS